MCDDDDETGAHSEKTDRCGHTREKNNMVVKHKEERCVGMMSGTAEMGTRRTIVYGCSRHLIISIIQRQPWSIADAVMIIRASHSSAPIRTLQ